MKTKGNLFVVAAPSGTGKTTLVKAVVDSMSHITVSISHTTRNQRPGEQNGVNYYFITKDNFKSMIGNNEFLEHAIIFDHLYGTSKNGVEQTLLQGNDVILEIDWQGHQQIKQLFPETVSIFILPPSLSALQERLIKRNQDHPDIIQKRLADTRESVSHIQEFDYVIVNDDFSRAEHDLKTIIEASRLLKARQSRLLVDLIKSLS